MSKFVGIIGKEYDIKDSNYNPHTFIYKDEKEGRIAPYKFIDKSGDVIECDDDDLEGISETDKIFTAIVRANSSCRSGFLDKALDLDVVDILNPGSSGIYNPFYQYPVKFKIVRIS